MKESQADDLAVRGVEFGECMCEVHTVWTQSMVFAAAIERLDGELCWPAEPGTPVRAHHMPGDAEQPGAWRQPAIVECFSITERLLEHLARRILCPTRVAEP